MVRVGRVALDGTKVRANASKRKAMSYARMSEKEKILAQEVSALLAEAERTERPKTTSTARTAAAMSYPRSCGAAKPAWPRSAKPRPPWEGGRRSGPPAGRNQGPGPWRGRGQHRRRGRRRGRRATPKPKAQRNFTDPDSKIMLTGDGAFHQCYNAPAVVERTIR